MTIWLTEDRAETGNIFGSKDFFKGLGLMIDTYDNDGKRDNPSLYAVIGDGNTAFNHNNDGGDAVIGKCRVYARNAINPLTIRASYADKTLMVSVDETSNGKYYEPCFTVSKIEIPTGYYFGVSAATGGLADDHIVQSFQTFSRQSAAQNEQRKQDATLKLSDEEHEDLVRKFGEHVAEFNANQNAYKQEHKDDADYQEDPSEVVNGYGAKTLEAISEFQRSLNAMFQFEMKELDANIKNNHILVLRQLKTMKKQIQQINEKMELQGNLLHESVGEAKGSSGDTKSLERLISSMGIKIDAMTEKVGALEHKYDQLEKGIKFQQESGHKDIKRSLKQETQKMKAHVEEGGNSYFWAAAVVVAVQVVLLIAYIVFKKTSEREKKFI
ncbi:hypothetical protein SARC_03187 [Sphaeroforma arctica JP610]|uniref:L-type lectin-like domain-containing protein n=1 Tax=Sphaeroforma arctica JP610 TaxID=667725 RepID=A0A0L0G6F5_9EUKA|nr:hypothetical protein SARC_03187 [Sphaeroforma arctica JP610]KNC84590.1 hypothetical protein SARC_03187 [Sphaeroforma arctica JP610]|eukprot:XP_014158492.1 hypothetical protein SARC_03187 [Sphaeroforma arctica JP610]